MIRKLLSQILPILLLLPVISALNSASAPTSAYAADVLINRNQVRTGRCAECAAASSNGFLTNPTINGGTVSNSDVSGGTVKPSSGSNATGVTLQRLMNSRLTLEAYGGAANNPAIDNSVAMARLVADQQASAANPITVYGDCGSLYYANGPFIIPDGVTLNMGCGQVGEYGPGKSYSQSWAVAKIIWNLNTSTNNVTGPVVGDSFTFGAAATTLANASTGVECSGQSGPNSGTVVSFVPHYQSYSVYATQASTSAAIVLRGNATYITNGATVQPLSGKIGTGVTVSGAPTYNSTTNTTTIVLSANTLADLQTSDSITINYALNANTSLGSNQVYVETSATSATPQATEIANLIASISKSLDSNLSLATWNFTYYSGSQLNPTTAYPRLVMEVTSKTAGAAGDALELSFSASAANYTSISSVGWATTTASTYLACLQGGRNAIQGGGLAINTPTSLLITNSTQTGVVPITLTASQATINDVLTADTTSLQTGGVISNNNFPDGDFISKIIDGTHFAVAYPPSTPLTSGTVLYYGGGEQITTSSNQSVAGTTIPVADTTNIATGSIVIGTYIPANTTVYSKVANVSITLSNSTTAPIPANSVLMVQPANLSVLPVASSSGFYIGELLVPAVYATITAAQTGFADPLTVADTSKFTVGNLIKSSNSTSIVDPTFVSSKLSSTQLQLSNNVTSTMTVGQMVYQPKSFSVTNYIHGVCQIVGTTSFTVTISCTPTAPLPSGTAFAVESVGLELGSSAAFENGYIVQAGLQNPAADGGMYALNVKNYQGLAISPTDPVNGTADSRIENAAIIGFQQALYSNSARNTLKDVYLDDSNGVEYVNENDVITAYNLRMLNYYEGKYINWLGVDSSGQRRGPVLSIHDGKSGSMFDGVYSYGADLGVVLYNEYYNTLTKQRFDPEAVSLETPRLLYAQVTSPGNYYNNIACTLSLSRGEKYIVSQSSTGSLLSIAFVFPGYWTGSETPPLVYCGDAGAVTVPSSANQTVNNQFTFASLPANLKVNQLVSGTGVPANTYVQSINTGTNTITLTNSTTALEPAATLLTFSGWGAAASTYFVYNNALTVAGTGSSNKFEGLITGATIGINDQQIADTLFASYRINNASTYANSNLCDDIYLAGGATLNLLSGAAVSACSGTTLPTGNIVAAPYIASLVLGSDFVYGSGGINADPTSYDNIINNGAGCANCAFNPLYAHVNGGFGVAAIANSRDGILRTSTTHLFTGFTTSTSSTRLTEDGYSFSSTTKNSACLNRSNSYMNIRELDITGWDQTTAGNLTRYLLPIPGALLYETSGPTTAVLQGGVTSAAPSFYSGNGNTATFSISADNTYGCLKIQVTAPNTDKWSWTANVETTDGS